MLKQESYVKTEDGVITEIRCKGCGVVIRKLIPSDSHGTVERINGKIVVRERLILACLPNYREVAMEFEDGTKHVTCLCDQCAEKMGDPEVVRKVYHQDLDQFESEGAVHRHGERNRKFHRLLKVAPQIGVL